MLMKEREVQYFFMNMTWVSYSSISLQQTPQQLYIQDLTHINT